MILDKISFKGCLQSQSGVYEVENYPCGGLIRHLRAFDDETEDFCLCSSGIIKEIKASILF